VCADCAELIDAGNQRQSEHQAERKMPNDRRQHREPNPMDPDGLAGLFLLTELDLANTFLEVARTSARGNQSP
jgi:hypothetical protein